MFYVSTTSYLVLVDANASVRMAMLREVLETNSKFLVPTLPVKVQGRVGIELMPTKFGDSVVCM
jgi:hypothetical protein